jgi:3-deoxy-D-manno-octulosonate 8-phosphate phosphatase (KDO 8-P phosphatase)
MALTKPTLSFLPKMTVIKAKAIKAVISDIDGVLTDGGITYDADGKETKTFNVKDGMIVKYLKDAGIVTGWISGRSSSMNRKRAKELQLDFIYEEVSDKLGQLEIIKHNFGLENHEICFIGDDLNDWPILDICGLSATPKDAPSYIKSPVDIVTKARGGKGVFREVAEIVLLAQGKFL